MKFKHYFVLLFLIFIISCSCSNNSTYHIEDNLKFLDFYGWNKTKSGPVYIYTDQIDSKNSLQYNPPRDLSLLSGNLSDFNNNIKINEFGCGKYKLISVEEIPLKNLKAAHIIYECDEFGTFYKVRQIRVSNGIEYIGFDLYSQIEDFPDNNIIMNSILESIIWE